MFFGGGVGAALGVPEPVLAAWTGPPEAAAAKEDQLQDKGKGTRPRQPAQEECTWEGE